MDLTNIDDLKVALELAGLKAAKGLGQHFLVDQESLERIMAAGELSKDDVVLEIGPGLGVMTVPLTRKVKKVIAVEMDRTLAELLDRDRPSNLEILPGDIMKTDLWNLPAGYKVVANIPYYLTSNLIRMLLENPNPPAIMSLLVQREVAQRIAAKPGSMSVLSFSVQYYGEPKMLETVERHKFWPPPKVDSAILQIEVRPKPAFAADRDKLFRLVKAGFGERRKMLKNSLAGGLNISIELATKLVAGANLPSTARAQELSIEDWERLYKQAEKHKVL
jgi:16S rRNA (adenine1518-N6/adenine1519-N6)-dimethyltransferase